MTSSAGKKTEGPAVAVPVAGAVFTGMAVAQIVATIQVWLSNLRLHRELRIVAEAGYLPVPNADTMPLLLKAGSAFWGGLFFTLTVGAFLSLTAAVFAWGGITVFNRRKWVLAMGAAVWAAVLGLLAAGDIGVMGMGYFIAVPPAVIGVCAVCRRDVAFRGSLAAAAAHIAVICMLAAVWTHQLDKRMFVDFRDGMLLSNPVGRKINDFYYRYTMYPAAVFKAPAQKQIRTVVFADGISRGTAKKLEDACLASDYLPVPFHAGADLTLRVAGDRLIFEDRGRPVLETGLAAFLAGPRQRFKDFSRQADHQALFRYITFFSLLIGLPVFLYLVFYTAGRWTVARVMADGPGAAVVSALLCLAAGLALLIPFHMSRAGQYGEKDVAGLIQSRDWMDRVNGLKVIVENRLDPLNYSSYRDGASSPHVPERYWLALALGQSRKEDAAKALRVLINDPHPNVRCQVYRAMGKRKNRSDIPIILEKYGRSRHWYEQTYAYRALREMGWKQEKSTMAPS